jgi:hypothetical protein
VLNVFKLSGVMLSVVMLNVVAPFKSYKNSLFTSRLNL